jgi:hypothetical protein
VSAAQAGVAIAGLLLAGIAGAAAPRTAPVKNVEAPAAIVEPAVWMKRLAGRFRVEGAIRHEEMVDFSPQSDAPPTPLNPEGEVRGTLLYLYEWVQSVQGKADCVGIGKGPGLQCVINLVWPEQWRVTGQAQIGGVANLSPAMILAGLVSSDPDSGIRILLVDEKGIGYPGAPALSGDTAIVRPPCVNHPGMQRCEQVARLAAKADASTLFMQLSVKVRFMRNKSDRKRFLERVDPDDPLSPMEKSMESVEEILDVSLSLKPLPLEDTRAAPGQVSRP